MSVLNFLPILLLFIILYILFYNQKAIIVRKILKKRNPEERVKMVELAKRFIGKECLVYAFDSNHQFEGVIREVSNGAILLEKDTKLEAINLDFVIRIREYPRKKNGKKKSVVVD